VRVLIDACLPVELRTLLEGTEVKTARDMGWQRLDNGELLNKADGRFDALVTMDKSMPHSRFLSAILSLW
jgi:predicted nuclease of predicted toxin-antitoxin system